MKSENRKHLYIYLSKKADAYQEIAEACQDCIDAWEPGNADDQATYTVLTESLNQAKNKVHKVECQMRNMLVD